MNGQMKRLCNLQNKIAQSNLYHGTDDAQAQEAPLLAERRAHLCAVATPVSEEMARGQLIPLYFWIRIVYKIVQVPTRRTYYWQTTPG
jgi:hypothetical protein